MIIAFFSLDVPLHSF